MAYYDKATFSNNVIVRKQVIPCVCELRCDGNANVTLIL